MSPRRGQLADVCDLGSGNADIMMLYQAIQETRACGGQVDLEMPHPDKPLRFLFQFTARRPVIRDGVAYTTTGEPASIELTFSLSRTGPVQARATFYDHGDAEDRLTRLGFEAERVRQILNALGWPR